LSPVSSAIRSKADLPLMPPRMSSTARWYVRSVALASPVAALPLAAMEHHSRRRLPPIYPTDPRRSADGDTASRNCGTQRATLLHDRPLMVRSVPRPARPVMPGRRFGLILDD